MRASFSLMIAAVGLTGCGGGGGGGSPAVSAPPPQSPPQQLAEGPDDCVDGRAGDFSCSGISLRKRVPLDAMEGVGGTDIWGWRDADSGKEYALMGLTTGTAFVDVTNPDAPVFIGKLATRAAAAGAHDIKVYQDHAYVVADNDGVPGMQVFDLTRLRDAVPPQEFSADVVYGDFEHAHNLAINEESGFAYAVLSDSCGGGLHMIDIGTPINPVFAGCHSMARTHDTQCVIYRGDDGDYAGGEICFSSSSSHFEIVDVRVKSAPVTISANEYPELGFVHQGWLTEDHRFFLIDDEADENRFNVPTRTHVFGISDLDAPEYLFAYEATTASTDHNLFVLGNRIFQANNTSGLRVLEFGDLAAEELTEIAYFDTFPASAGTGLSGAWGVYPYLPSGNIIVSDRSHGLFVLSMQ